MDPEDGNITSRILTCPPGECLPFNCPGHELQRKGIQGCGADTDTADVGTVLSFDFVVMDLSVPPAVTRATRLLRVVSPCAAAETYCPELEAPHDCGSSSCPARAALLASEPADPVAPHLNFTTALPPALIADAAVASAPASPAVVPATLLESLAQAGAHAVGHVPALCGAVLPVPLGACAGPSDPDLCTANAWHADASSAMPGWAFALSPVTDSACTSERMQLGECAACTADAALFGGCLPGVYAFALSAQAPNGLWAEAHAAVVVSVRAVVVSGDVGVRVVVRATATNGSTADDAASAEARLQAAMAGAGDSEVSEVALAAGRAFAAALPLHGGTCSLGPFGDERNGGSVVVQRVEAAGSGEVAVNAEAGGVVSMTVSAFCGSGPCCALFLCACSPRGHYHGTHVPGKESLLDNRHPACGFSCLSALDDLACTFGCGGSVRQLGSVNLATACRLTSASRWR